MVLYFQEKMNETTKKMEFWLSNGDPDTVMQIYIVTSKKVRGVTPDGYGLREQRNVTALISGVWYWACYRDINWNMGANFKPLKNPPKFPAGSIAHRIWN